MITVAALAPSVDLTYVVDSLRLGQIHRPSSVTRVAGGKPLNLARAAAVLGADVEVVALLGGRTGQWLADELHRLGIVVAEVPAAAPTRTCVSIASADRGDLTEIYEFAEEVPDGEWERLVTVLDQQLRRRPGWLAISGGPPRALPTEALAELVELAHRAGVRVAADTHGPSLLPLVAARPELVKINRQEAGELLGVQARATPGDLAEMATAIRQRTGGTVVLTDGTAGTVGVEPNGVVRHPPPIRTGPYPVGSGDSFLGGLLTGLDAGRSLADALRLAVAAGTANALLPGPGRFDPELARRLASGEDC